MQSSNLKTITKLCAYKAPVKPASTAHGGPHVLVPFAMEDGGRPGAHAQALLLDLARRVVKASKNNMPLRLDSEGGVGKGEGVTQMSVWVQKWQRRLYS